MKIPYSWLSEYVDLDGVDPNDVARRLTLHTCEVEGVHRIGAGLEPIVVGEVVACAKHPNADNLSVTRVNVGIGELLPIVCGAPNVAKGQKVAIVLPGTRLPGGLEVGERKIRGEVSRGMICSEKELGLGDDHDGIVVLEPEAAVGAKLVALPSIQDWVLEIDNKSVNHRPDLWGIHGFAREVGAILGKSLTRLRDLVDPRIDEWWSANPANSQGSFPVEVADPARCPRYLAAVFEGTSIGPSPAWMARRLRLVGARPISNVVDLTNYVMFELGQPTHAFDRAKLRGGRIVVRTARAGESLTTLDGQVRKLVSTDLLICDAEGPVGLAGVMGGANSEIDASTRAIVLESATFDGPTVRRTAARLALRSEASTRFEKTLSHPLARLTVDRIATLLQSKVGIWGAKAALAAPVTDVLAGKPNKARPARAAKEPAAATAVGEPENTKILLSWSFVAECLGLDRKKLDTEEAARLLESIEIWISKTNDPDVVEAAIPFFRATKDLTEPIDLVEEIARLRGYDKIAPRALEAPVEPPPSQGERRALVRLVEDRLVGLGFRGLETYSFVSDALVSQLGLQDQRYVTLANSLVADQSRVRREVVPSLLGIVRKNLGFEGDLRLFEAGKGYRPETPRRDPLLGSDPREPQEAHMVGGVLARRKTNDRPAGFASGAFFEMKGIVASLIDGLDANARFFDLTEIARLAGVAVATPPPYFHPKRTIFMGWSANEQEDVFGFVMEVHPQALAALGLDGIEVAAFEIDLARLESARAAAVPRRFQGIPKFPGVSVDVALLAPAARTVAELEALVRSADPQLCRRVELFDIYAGAELGEARRSAAFHVELRSDERTLAEGDEAAFLKSLAARCARSGVTLRGWNG